MKILALITDRVLPTINATRVRNYFLWTEIKNLGVDLKILGINLEPHLPTAIAPEEWNAQLFPFVREPFSNRALHTLLYSYHQWPCSKLLKNSVIETVNNWKPDIIHAEELRMAAYLPALQNIICSAKQTVSLHNVESDWLQKTGSSPIPGIKKIIEKIHSVNLKKFEKKTIAKTNLCFAYSTNDQERYKEIIQNGKWGLTSGGASIKDHLVQEQVSTKNILLTGTLNYMPNIEGILWFIDSVLPKLDPSIQITIAGSRIQSDTKKRILSTAKIQFIDTPKELDSLYTSHAISIVPLLSGSGTRGKILESLSNTRAVVTTSKGAEGLALKNHQGIVLADSAEKFANAIHFLLNNTTERKKIAENGYHKVLECYDWRIVAKNLVQDWEKIL